MVSPREEFSADPIWKTVEILSAGKVIYPQDSAYPSFEKQGAEADGACQWDTKRKLFNLAEVCTRPSAVQVFLSFEHSARSHNSQGTAPPRSRDQNCFATLAIVELGCRGADSD